MKFMLLKKILMKEAGIFAVILLVIGAAMFFMMNKESSLNDEMNSLNSNVSSVNGESQTLQAQYTKAKNSLTLYRSIEDGKQSMDDSLSRENATKLINRLKEEYLLSSLSMTITPMVDIKDSGIDTKTATLVFSEVTLKFSAMSDEQFFSFVNAISREFPGYLTYTKLDLKRTSPINTEIFKAVSRGDRPALVNGEVAFKWYGLKSNAETPKPAEGAAAAPGGEG